MKIPTHEELRKAIETIQAAFESAEENADGPWIQIRPKTVEMVDPGGVVIASNIDEVLANYFTQ